MSGTARHKNHGPNGLGGHWMTHPITGDRMFVCPCGYEWTPKKKES